MAVGNLAGIAASRLGRNVLVDTIQPTQWRSLCGLPTRGKEPVSEWANNVLGRSVTQDEADALGIATAAHHTAWKGNGS
jgi:Holliday junction resolvasome RuvABC endonuclease subunit